MLMSLEFVLPALIFTEKSHMQSHIIVVVVSKNETYNESLIISETFNANSGQH